MGKKRKSEQSPRADEEGDGEVSGVSLNVGCERAGAHQVQMTSQVLPGEGTEAKDDWNALRNLNADILVQVFSYLNPRSLFEVMIVNTHWEKTVREGR